MLNHCPRDAGTIAKNSIYCHHYAFSNEKKTIFFNEVPISLHKYSQMVGWWLVQHGKCCVYAKRMFSQNFRIYEKKLARRRAYLVYKGKSWTLQWSET